MFEEEPEERLGDSIAALLPVLFEGCLYGEECPGPAGCVVASVFAELAEGPLTADAVRVLAGVDPDRLSGFERADYLRLADRVVSWAGSRLDAGVLAVAGAVAEVMLPGPGSWCRTRPGRRSRSRCG